jgi:hypothetical protein
VSDSLPQHGGDVPENFDNLMFLSALLCSALDHGDERAPQLYRYARAFARRRHGA